MGLFRVKLDKMYIRNKIPASTNDNSNIIGIAFLGYTFEGNEIENDWYKDINGNFYWSGGIEPVTTVLEDSNIDLEKHYWYKKLAIATLHQELNTKGEGVTVLVLDTGITSNPELQNKLKLDIDNSRNFTNGIADKNISDNVYHGTNMAYLIGSSDNKYPGVAPNVKIIIGKISDGDIGLVTMANALNYFKESNLAIDIVSISGGKLNPSQTQIDKLRDSISEFITAKNAIVIAALGNNNNKSKGDYPAILENVIAVGSVDRNGNNSTFCSSPTNASLKLYGEEIASFSENNQPIANRGTSEACALSAGLLALIIAFQKNKLAEEYSSEHTKELMLNSLDERGVFDTQKLLINTKKTIV